MAKIFMSQCNTCGAIVDRTGELYKDYRNEKDLTTEKLRTFDKEWTAKGFTVLEIIMPDHEYQREVTRPSVSCQHVPDGKS